MKGIKILKFSTFLFSTSLVKTLPDIYYQLFLYLVEAIHILLEESISKEAL